MFNHLHYHKKVDLTWPDVSSLSIRVAPDSSKSGHLPVEHPRVDMVQTAPDPSMGNLPAFSASPFSFALQRI
ncbi:hypothetical protein M8818_005455 [Zalaria obscura]|uniref:Uncharacterized protein n=1 Tax=Zalaria obscura TaxID=2024903 RepID=A0ACC3S8Y1_9PEZI